MKIKQFSHYVLRFLSKNGKRNEIQKSLRPHCKNTLLSLVLLLFFCARIVFKILRTTPRTGHYYNRTCAPHCHTGVCNLHM